ncbi:MAG: Crp/Fnr family transcriptional regulator [Caulobacter sp.]|nr:Crp/Fnr family transcriptional regulator [Caulobacter sp.]
MRIFLERLAEESLPDWTELAPLVTARTCQRGELIFDQGAPDLSLRFLTRGVVRLAYQHEDGRRHTKSIIVEGDLVASASALAGGETTFSAVALTSVGLLSIPYPAVERLMARHIAWERVARKLFAELARLKEQREFEFLTLKPEERWRGLLTHRPDLIGRVSQAELAALIGITPVALSRIKARSR